MVWASREDFLAKIPEYQQRQLESSLVGVPSVDTSGKRIAEGVSDLGETGMSVFGKQMIERRQALDAIEANKQATEYEVEVEKLFQTHQKTFAEDPQGKTDFFKSQAEQLLQTTLKNTKSKGAQQSVAIIGQRILGSKLAQEGKWALDQESSNALIDVSNTVDVLSNQAFEAGVAGNFQLASDTFARHRSILAASKSALNPESYAKLEKTAPELLAKGAINGMLSSHPEQVAEFIKALPPGTLDSQDIAKYKEDAKKAILNIKSIRDFEYLTDTVAVKNPDLFERYMKQDPTLLADLDRHPDKRVAKYMHNLILSQNPLSAEVKAEKYIELLQDYEGLHVVKRDNKYSTKTALDDILRFQENVMKAVSDGMITADQANSFMTKLSGPLAKKLAAAVKPGMFEVFKGPDDLHVGYRSISSWVDKQGYKGGVASRVKVEMIQDFISRMDREQPKNREEVSKLINTIQAERGNLDHPELAGMAEPPAAHYSSQGVLSPVASGSKAPTNNSVKKPYTRMYSQKENKYYRKYADGTIEEEKNA